MLLIWYTVLFILTFASLLNWTVLSLPFEARKRRLELADLEFRQRDFFPELDEFVRDHVKLDGILVFKMIMIHAGVLICAEIVSEMWDQFLNERGRLQLGRRGGVPETPNQNARFRRKMGVLVPLMTRMDSINESPQRATLPGVLTRPLTPNSDTSTHPLG
ncbi:CBN-INX-20 protein [Aphelenchoides avenae]|nr:CBN-INX-20 protein [Aphelenchus avenae]